MRHGTLRAGAHARACVITRPGKIVHTAAPAEASSTWARRGRVVGTLRHSWQGRNNDFGDCPLVGQATAVAAVNATPLGLRNSPCPRGIRSPITATRRDTPASHPAPRPIARQSPSRLTAKRTRGTFDLSLLSVLVSTGTHHRPPERVVARPMKRRSTRQMPG